MNHEEKYELLADLMRDIERPVIFELGSHNGNDTVNLYNQLNASVVHTFEANPNQIGRISKKIKNKNIFLHNKIVSDINGKLDFNVVTKNRNQGSSSIYKINDESAIIKHHSMKIIKVVQVESITLDKFCQDNNINNIDLIWSDIQGAEPNMLVGAVNILKNTKFIIMECIRSDHYYDLKWYKWSFERICDSIPGNWSIVARMGADLLVKNDDLI